MKKTTTLTGLALAGIGVGYGYLNRTRQHELVAPELRTAMTRFRSPSMSPLLLKIARVIAFKHTATVPGVSLETRQIAAQDGSLITIYIYRPDGLAKDGPVFLHTHGGGMVAGSARHAHSNASAYARDLGMTVISTEYRLAPEYPFPVPLDDVHATYQWIIAHGDSLGLDLSRIVVAGESAGGGLTAGLCQRLLDAGGPQPVLQVLIYPMLDDRTCLQAAPAARGQIGWTPASNLFGWTSYLGQPPQPADAPDYAAPARRQDLSGLPPAWVGVGTLDLFLDEDRDYAERLQAAGVPCEYVQVEGAYHGFDKLVECETSEQFRTSLLDAVRTATA